MISHRIAALGSALCLTGVAVSGVVVAGGVVNDSGSPAANGLVNLTDNGQTSAEGTVGIAIENLCPQLVGRNNANPGAVPAAESDLRVRCGDLIFGNAQTDSNSSLRQVAGEEVATQESEVVELAAGQLRGAGARLAGLRSGITTTSKLVSFATDTSLRLELQRGGAAGDGIGDSGRLGVYANVVIGTGDKDQTERESGFDIDTSAITVGLDRRLESGTFIGGALGYNSSEADMSDNGGTLDVSGLSLLGYATKVLENGWYLDGTVGVGEADYDTVRNLGYTSRGVAVNQSALASTEATSTFASIGLGQEMPLGSSQGSTLGLSARLNFLDVDVDGFAERMSNGAAPGFGMALEMEDQQIDSLTSAISAQLSKAVSTESGVVLPYGRVTWIHEFEDDERVVQARFVNDPFSTGFNQTGSFPTIIPITLDKPDADYFRVAFGVSGILPGGKNWFVGLDTTVGLEGSSFYALSAGYRGEF